MYKLIIMLLLLIVLISPAIESGTISDLNLVYSGEVKLGLTCEKGVTNFLPSYLLYLQGEPYPGFYLMTYARSGGDLIDQIFIDYTKNNLEIQLGDNLFHNIGGKFLSFDQNQRGGLISYSCFNQSLKVEAMGALVKGLNQIEELEGQGNAGPYFLHNGPIIPGSEILKKNGIILTEDDYEINYQTRMINFLEPVEKDEMIEISYTYQPGGGNYERVLSGLTLSGDWCGFNGNVNWIKVEDYPREGGFIFLPPRLLEIGVFKGDWQKFKWLKLENELAWSEVSGDLKYSDWAYDGVFRLGESQSYLEGRYTYCGSEFRSSLDQVESTPLVEYFLEGRWQVNPYFYFISMAEYNHDNPEMNPELITTYESYRFIKGYWQCTPTSYIQLVFQEKDTGDDLIYLPLGQTNNIVSLFYHYQGPWSLNLGIDGGDKIWKSQSSSVLNYQYMKLNSMVKWKNSKWDSLIEYNSEYIHLIEDQADQINHFLKYMLKYKIYSGEISIAGEEDIETEYLRHFQEVSFKKRLMNNLHTQIKYQREMEVYSKANNVPKEKLIFQIFYHGSVRIEARWNQNNQSTSGRIAVSGKKKEVQFNWLENEKIKQYSSKVKLNLFSKLNLQSMLTYEITKSENQSNLGLVVNGVYKMNENIKFNFFGEIPLNGDIENTKECNGKIEIIISL
ncbi:MAG: hypothetical protein KAX49_07785 [Halanaerobiales bacterium]|nr:hypothetical protein [Halanaerobiales bacterium]